MILEDPWLPITFHRVLDRTGVDFVQIQIVLMDFAVVVVEIHQGIAGQGQMRRIVVEPEQLNDPVGYQSH